MSLNKERYTEIFKNIYENYGFGGLESHSGPGSGLDDTIPVREGILKIIKEKNIKTIVDIPCGDFNWMKEIVFRFESYIGGDIVEECIKENNERYSNSRIKFINFDILSDIMPEGDLLLVRDIFGHFPINDGITILENIKRSKCKYLLSTTWYNVNDNTYYQKHDNTGPDDYGRFYAVNLMSEPFNLPNPEQIIIEDVYVDGYDEGLRKVLGLWNIEEIRTPKEITIRNLITKYGSDKTIAGYSDYYDLLFQPIKEKVTSVLEIGIGSLSDGESSFHGNLDLNSHYRQGGSLRAWRDFFINADVYGVDISKDCKFKEERIRTFIFNSLDEKMCNHHLKDQIYDIIIDDGLHTAEAQITTLKNLFHRVKNGGYYIIEDCGGSGDGTNIFIDYNKEFLSIAEEHEFVFLRNQIFIRKNNSKRGESTNFNAFLMDKTLDINVTNKDLTVVTGLWNIGRTGRDFSHYIEHFQNFLEIPVNMFIYIPAEYEYLVWEKRTRKNTYVKISELEDVRRMYDPFWDKTQEIRNNPEWHNLAGWLKESPQASLEWYNPIVQSKMFFLNDVTFWNPFNTEYFIWLDAGITNTVGSGFLTNERALDKINPLLEQFLFLSYPYQAGNEIHGFKFNEINNFANNKVEYVCRGGLFGGRKEFINQANSSYYTMLNNTLNQGLMGTEESIFSILSYREPHVYRRYALDGNGLIVKFIQELLTDKVQLEPIPEKNKLMHEHVKSKTKKAKKEIKTNLYILTFNFPEQLLYTIDSMKKVPEWLEIPHLVLLDNSTIEESKEKNKKIAEEYNFEYVDLIKNTGICGGRQAAAEHFHKSGADYMVFFEDDMTVNSPEVEGQFCRNGFRKYVPNLYNIIHKIMIKENFDFLKLSFTEVYFDNDKQCSWYNVPQEIRTRDWPHYDQLPVSGLDSNVPLTEFKNINVLDGVPYITGEIYYANWPTILSHKGNKKMFIDTKWSYPYEQTWMSHFYQMTKEGKLNPAVLLCSPIWHERIAYYKPDERREN